ncbi:MAG: hypothetical protein GX445_02470 [Elusimicrobia bacterium]|nr:hypothetical protein [Elusimicrobiota bacterium]
METTGVEFFERLMPKRIKKVLLVASLYDSFLFADDEMLSEVLFEHNMTNREHFNITRVKNSSEAIELLKNDNYDVVISMMQSVEFDMEDFVLNIKKMRDIPVVILSFSMHDIGVLTQKTRDMVEGVFLWQGDTKIFSSIINFVEDRINFEHDLSYGVQSVLLVEDNIRFYSMYLPIIYYELIKQMHIVMSDELNISRKILRMKARPKIYLAKTYEEAWEIFDKYNNNLLGVITDVEYPILEHTDEKAGLLLTKRVKEKIVDMPVLIQSSNTDYEPVALKMGASFLNKNSPDISKQLRGFIQRYFGFGDFIFDDGNGKEIARASDLSTMIKVLKVIPDKSIFYHASRNHFSKWLLARTEFDIAYKIKPKAANEFASHEELRNYLIETMHQFMYKTQLGSILRFDRNKYSIDIPFAKIGYGSIGGKARGLAFIDYLIGKGIIRENINGINIKTPNSVVVATDVFDLFIERNNLSSFINGNYSDDEISKIFENVNLPDYALNDIAYVIDKIKGPVAVRSSSLLEDSKNYPFAGIYKTYMFANTGKVYENLKTVERIIKYIYASTFSKDAIEFRKSNPHIPDEEKMAVIIQSVVGREYVKGYYFPLISGVLQSYNFYPVHPLKNTDPVVHIAMGLGESVVSGRYFLRYSPAHPNNIHQFATVDDIIKTTQKKFMAVSLNNDMNINYDRSLSVVEKDFEDIQPSDEMKAMFSSYIFNDDKLVDHYEPQGTNLLTFFPVIKNNFLPLNEILLEISEKCVDAMGGNIELEFALNMDMKTSAIDLNILQVKHFASKINTKKINMNFDNKDLIVHSKNIVGSMYNKEIRDVVFVKKESFSNLKTLDIRREVGIVNSECKKHGCGYILIGPGRWGTSDIHLGIPIKWNDISMARVIIESLYDSFNVTPSYGTHFFHNIIAMSIPYISVIDKDDLINWNLLNSSKTIYETDYVRWVRFDEGLETVVDGSDGFIVAMRNRG